MQPIALGPNMPAMFYRGAGRIDRLRGTTGHEDRPEDWIASVTSRFGSETDGKTTLPDGTLLADAVASDPKGWLGPEHVAKYGSDTGLLVKLLDAGQRLPVHVHPDRSFAAEHLASPHGKTEAWVIIEASPDAAVHLGFNRDVTAAELNGWARDQDIETLLAVTNRVPVSAGDTVLCPAGTPHAISEGILAGRAPGACRPVDHAGVEHVLAGGGRGHAGAAAGGGAVLHRPAGLPAGAAHGVAGPFAEQRDRLAAARRCGPVLPGRTVRCPGQPPAVAELQRAGVHQEAMVTWPPRTVRRCRWAGAAWSPSRTRPARPCCPATWKASAACRRRS